MELKIDNEFRDLIPPLTEEEYSGLESAIVENGFNPAYPIITWKGQDIIVDGHNRYSICTKHNIAFEFIEQEFASRYEVCAWMVENQLKRRNVNSLTKTYLVGRRYLLEKQENGGDRKSLYQNDKLIPETHKRIASQLNIGSATVTRASEFTLAVDKIVANTGIQVNDILSGKIKIRAQDDIKKLASCPPETQVKVIERVTKQPDSDIKSVMRDIAQEEVAREAKESAERKRLALEAVRKEREENERREAERIRIERLEKEREEKFRLEQERLRREIARKEREEQERLAREKYEREKAEKEKIRKEHQEQERLAREKLAAEQAEKARIEKERLAAERAEIERQRLERVAKEKLEKEKLDKERAEQKALADAEAEKKRLERLALEKERQEQQRIENERLEKERLEKCRLEEERQAKERVENERLEKERKEKERIENERLAIEKAENDRIEKERLEKLRIENEKLELERVEQERIAKEKLEQFNLEQERIAKEKLEQYKKEQERIEQERQQEILISEAEEEGNGLFDVILCDPPWRYDFAETKNREIENQYPTMDLEDIKALSLPAADDCILFMWATAPKLEQAFEVLKAWGFTYKTCAVWDKELIGMGYWFRGQHELLLVGTRGKPCVPEAQNRVSSVIKSRREGHSKKPDCVYDIIEKMCPGGRNLEMFARNAHPGWVVWGNQV